MSGLFPDLPEELSPRLKWMLKKNIKTIRREDGKWVAFKSETRFNNSDENEVAQASTPPCRCPGACHRPCTCHPPCPCHRPCSCPCRPCRPCARPRSQAVASEIATDDAAPTPPHPSSRSPSVMRDVRNLRLCSRSNVYNRKPSSNTGQKRRSKLRSTVDGW